MPDALIFGDSVRLPELRHEVPIAIIDPFLYVERDGERHVVVSSMEADRIRAVDGSLVVHPTEAFGRDEFVAQGVSGGEVMVRVAARAVEELGVREAVVPPAFPLEVADRLREAGVVLRPDRPGFADRRRVKTAAELAGVRRAQAAATAGMEAAAAMLRAAGVDGESVVLDGAPLTCERLRRAVIDAFLDHDAGFDDFVVSHGAQTAIGHDPGSGAIRAGEPVALDLWPYDAETGCYADMARTFVVGDAPEELRSYHALAREAFERALALVKAGVSTRAVYDASAEVFEAAGHPTQRTKRAGESLEDGFFWALGHGVGLAVHEPPVLSVGAGTLRAGDVIAVEPGCVRHGFGGVRMEDVVLVTDDGYDNLTDYPYDLEP